jgi:hypothetical protein
MSDFILALAIGHMICTLAVVVGGGWSFLRRRQYPASLAAVLAINGH